MIRRVIKRAASYEPPQMVQWRGWTWYRVQPRRAFHHLARVYVLTGSIGVVQFRDPWTDAVDFVVLGPRPATWGLGVEWYRDPGPSWSTGDELADGALVVVNAGPLGCVGIQDGTPLADALRLVVTPLPPGSFTNWFRSKVLFAEDVVVDWTERAVLTLRHHAWLWYRNDHE